MQVSLQFHMTFNTGFQMVKQLDLNLKWQSKTYFTSKKEETTNTNSKWAIKNTTFAQNKRPRLQMDTSKGDLQNSVQLEETRQVPEGEQVNIRTREEQITWFQSTNRPIKRLKYVHAAEVLERTQDSILGDKFAMEAVFPENKESNIKPLAMKVSVDPDTMYLHKAMDQLDRKHVLKAMEKEANDQYKKWQLQDCQMQHHT